MQKRNTKLGGKEPLVKNKRSPKENEIEHTGTFKKSTNGLHGGSSKEHSPFQKVSNYTHTPPRKITFPTNKLQKKYILKELTNKFENLNMSDPDDDYFTDISSNIKRDVIIIDDEPETLNNQNDEFRAPSPTRNKYANLPEIDLLSDDETSIQSSTSRRKGEGSAEHKRCPFCNEAIPLPLPERIRAYLIKINPSARDKLSDQTQNISPSSFLQRSLNIIDQFEFCRLHDAESHIVPEGLKKNYPIKIDFERLPKRVKNLVPELMLIIKGKRKSLYRDVALCAYQEFGRARARKPTILMGRFQKFQPGYYGSKGASIIFSSLVSLFMDTNILTMDMTKPQEPLEYLNQVLVPETAIRLISRDRGGIPLEDARKVMESSVEFGMYVHDVDDDLDNK
ncbi:4807_t:CDS:2 [Funneliformis caledonium]|uniref:Restriction of telomere capping protein 4 n=1 Tax=Funneliformis caledonium TaxID=1117310 RepID=A0A9N8W411_9GLOM|nr:4807_t:CDS:2 [Funneliformis caledonium]